MVSGPDDSREAASRALENAYILPTYANIRMPLTLVRGEGSYVFDENDVRYLDLYGGHAVTSIGHSHPRWVAEVQAQIASPWPQPSPCLA